MGIILAEDYGWGVEEASKGTATLKTVPQFPDKDSKRESPALEYEIKGAFTAL
jgi:hypothetical protein